MQRLRVLRNSFTHAVVIVSIMLRKYSIFIRVSSILTLLVPLFVSAASEYESSSNVAAGVIGTAGTGATYELSPSKIFSFDSDFGQDLYENTYNRVKSEASDKAVERVLADRKVSKEELFAVVPGANIGKLLTQPDSAGQLSPDVVEKRRQDVQNFLADEKELADLEVRTTMEVQPTELFSNGDESDSGFDLIADLTLIELILFGKVEAPMSGAGPGAPAGSNVIDVGGGAAPAGAGGPNNAGVVDGGPEGAGGGSGGSGGGAGGPAGIPAGPGGGEPVQVRCPLEQSFNNAVEAARSREQAAEENAGGENGGGGADGGDHHGHGNGGAGAAGGGAAGADAGGEKSAPPIPEVPANWVRPRACDGVFCIKVEAIYKRESAFQDTDNCIACHFEKINDAFKKAVSHNLVPSKATGNLIEAPKCKGSMFNLKQNIILIPQPILTPPNDDLITKGDFLKNWIDYVEKYHANPGQCRKLKAEVDPPGEQQRDLSTKIAEVISLGQVCDSDKDERAEAAKRGLEQSIQGTDQQKILNEIQKQVDAKKAGAAEFLKQHRLQHDAGNQASQFSVLLNEIDTMNSYFASFENLYQQLISGESDSPCKTLINKETCS